MVWVSYSVGVASGEDRATSLDRNHEKVQNILGTIIPTRLAETNDLHTVQSLETSHFYQEFTMPLVPHWSQPFNKHVTAYSAVINCLVYCKGML